MTICAFGCQQVFLYHPADVEVEVASELNPFAGFNTDAVTDHITDAEWIPNQDPAFAYNPGGTILVIDTPEELEEAISTLVRALKGVIKGEAYGEAYRGERDMGKCAK